MAPARRACAGCQQRDQRLAELEAEVANLRRQLGQTDREQNRQAHPFRREQSTVHPKKPGRRKGHLLRRCKKLGDAVSNKEQLHVASLSDLLKEAIDLAARRDEHNATVYAQRTQDIEDRLDDWLDANLGRRTPSADLARRRRITSP